MNIFHTKKRLKKRWMRWNRTIWTISACVLVAWMAWRGVGLSDQMKELMTKEPLALETLGQHRVSEEAGDPPQDWLNELEQSGRVRIVHLNKIFTCGEENLILGVMKPKEIAELAGSHPDWVGRLAPGGDVWFDERIQGLSETCQRDGYVGIDKNGNLSLFDGPPKDEKVIRTFFQLDVETMESALPSEVLKQLNNGIRIQDVEEYNSVLSTFSDFAVENSKDTMQQTGQ